MNSYTLPMFIHCYVVQYCTKRYTMQYKAFLFTRDITSAHSVAVHSSIYSITVEKQEQWQSQYLHHCSYRSTILLYYTTIHKFYQSCQSNHKITGRYMTLVFSLIFLFPFFSAVCRLVSIHLSSLTSAGKQNTWKWSTDWLNQWINQSPPPMYSFIRCNFI